MAVQQAVDCGRCGGGAGGKEGCGDRATGGVARAVADGDCIHDGVADEEGLLAPRAGRHVLREARECCEVVENIPCGGVEDGEAALVEFVRSVGVWGLDVAAAAGAEEAVARYFDEECHRLAACRGRRDLVVRAAAVVVAADEALARTAVGVEDHRLGVRVPEEVYDAAVHLRWDGDVEAEDVRRPRRAERVADGGRAEGEGVEEGAGGADEGC